jgi:hypothetical protein
MAKHTRKAGTSAPNDAPPPKRATPQECAAERQRQRAWLSQRAGFGKTAGGAYVDREALARLEGLGFERGLAAEALRANENDLQASRFRGGGGRAGAFWGGRDAVRRMAHGRATRRRNGLRPAPKNPAKQGALDVVADPVRAGALQLAIVARQIREAEEGPQVGARRRGGREGRGRGRPTGEGAADGGGGGRRGRGRLGLLWTSQREAVERGWRRACSHAA